MKTKILADIQICISVPLNKLCYYDIYYYYYGKTLDTPIDHLADSKVLLSKKLNDCLEQSLHYN